MGLTGTIILNAVLAVLLVSSLLFMLSFFGIYESAKHEVALLLFHRNKTKEASV